LSRTNQVIKNIAFKILKLFRMTFPRYWLIKDIIKQVNLYKLSLIHQTLFNKTFSN